MHKRLIDPRRLLPLVLLTLTLLSPSLVSAANPALPADPEQPTPTDQTADIPRANMATPFGYVYTVAPGDDIWLIAIAHGLDMEQLAADNDLEPPYWLHPGDKLWVAAEPAVVRQPTPVPPAPEPAPQPAAVAAAPAEAPAAEPAAAPAAEAAASAAPPAPAGISPDAQHILDAMNQQRAAFGLHPYIWSDQLAAAAQAHAQDLANRGWGSHVGSDGARLRTRYERVGYWAIYASENWANARDAQHGFDMWWYEPDWGAHRVNILGANYVEVGIGVAKGGWGYYYVADFGSR